MNKENIKKLSILKNEMKRCGFTNDINKLKNLIHINKGHPKLSELYETVIVASTYNCCLDIMKYLVEELNVDVKNGNLLTLCYMTEDKNTKDSNCLEMIDYLIKKGANIHADDDRCLNYNAEYGNVEIVKYLVEHGANIHAENNLPIRMAARNNHKKVVEYLLEQGADITAKNNYALEYIAQNNHLSLLKYLVKKGIDIHAPIGKQENWSLLSISGQEGHVDFVQYLLEEQNFNIYEKDNKVIENIMQLNNLEMIELLLKNQVDTNIMKSFNVESSNQFIDSWILNNKLKKDLKEEQLPNKKNKL